jgi:hypothetical protein
MQALRQIIAVKSQIINIHLPDGFKSEKVEVIILPLEDEKLKGKEVASLRGKLKLTEEQYNDFQADVKISREGWEKNI